MRLAALAMLASCGGGAAAPHDAPAPDGLSAEVPVDVATAQRVDLPVVIHAPGRTAANEKLDIRAPFEGELADLIVSDGDHVKGGEVLGWVVSQESEAAVAGAQAMLRVARTRQERADAERGLALARRWLAKKALRAPEPAVVLSHGVDEGAHVTANESIVTLVPSSEIAFVAQVAQVDLRQVRAGETAKIDLSSSAQPLAATVHTILPGASPADLTVPVRLDFVPASRPHELDLFGTASITVGHHASALIVPAQAIIRDDVRGITRVAIIGNDDRARWVEVKTGLASAGRVELVSAPFDAGARVVISGLAGLPEGAHVRVVHATS